MTARKVRSSGGRPLWQRSTGPSCRPVPAPPRRFWSAARPVSARPASSLSGAGGPARATPSSSPAHVCNSMPSGCRRTARRGPASSHPRAGRRRGTRPARARPPGGRPAPSRARPVRHRRWRGVEPWGQGQLFEAVLELLTRAGNGLPVILVVEDLHWADLATLDLLNFVVRNVANQACSSSPRCGASWSPTIRCACGRLSWRASTGSNGSTWPHSAEPSCSSC